MFARDDGHRPVTFAGNLAKLIGARSASYENLRVLRAFVAPMIFPFACGFSAALLDYRAEVLA